MDPLSYLVPPPAAAAPAPSHVAPVPGVSQDAPVEFPTTGNGCLIVAAVAGILAVLALVLLVVFWLVV